LQDKENNIFYKSDFLDSIANLNKINFYKSLKDKENDFLEIDIKNLDKKYKLNLKTIMFFQSNEEKLYIIESAKTNLELYLDFLKEN
jgi:DNA-binding LytR/AlgR family response regulator